MIVILFTTCAVVFIKVMLQINNEKKIFFNEYKIKEEALFIILLRQILQHCLLSFHCPTKQFWPFIVWTLNGMDASTRIQNNSLQSQ